MLTLVTGYSNVGKTTLPLLFNRIKGWNYVVYSNNHSQKYNQRKRLLLKETYELKLARVIRKLSLIHI